MELELTSLAINKNGDWFTYESYNSPLKTEFVSYGGYDVSFSFITESEAVEVIDIAKFEGVDLVARFGEMEYTFDLFRANSIDISGSSEGVVTTSVSGSADNCVANFIERYETNFIEKYEAKWLGDDEQMTKSTKNLLYRVYVVSKMVNSEGALKYNVREFGTYVSDDVDDLVLRVALENSSIMPHPDDILAVVCEPVVGENSVIPYLKD